MGNPNPSPNPNPIPSPPSPNGAGRRFPFRLGSGESVPRPSTPIRVVFPSSPSGVGVNVSFYHTRARNRFPSMPVRHRFLQSAKAKETPWATDHSSPLWTMERRTERECALATGKPSQFPITAEGVKDKLRRRRRRRRRAEGHSGPPYPVGVV